VSGTAHSHWCNRADEMGRCRAAEGSLVIHVAALGEFFATRDSARKLIAQADALPLSLPVILDWRGVAAVTGAFADEFARWAMATHRKTGSDGMNADVLAAYNLACKRIDERAAACAPAE